MPEHRDRAALRRRLAFVGALLFFAGVAIAFRAVLLPFMVAGLMAFVMEPVVSRLSARRVRGRAVPRWVAVLAVYIGFFLTLGLVGAWAGPRLGEEAQRLIADAPQFFQRVKREWIPDINEFLRGLMRKFRRDEPGRAKELITAARGPAWRPEIQDLGALAWRAVQARPRIAEDPVDPRLARRALERALREADRGQLLAKRLPDGSYSVQMQRVALELRDMGKGRYQVLFHEREKAFPKESEPEIDVEKAVEERLHTFVDGFGARFIDYIGFGKELVVTVFGGIGLIALTFVIAAFLSIDLAAVHRFFRSLVPRGLHADYDQLMQHLDRGLSGVIRGQLLICVINGILTAIGLYLLGVPYAGIWSLFAAAMSLIPIFGTIISSAPMIGVSLFTTDPVGILGLSGLTLALAVLAWILVIHFVEANILEPKIVGKHAKIHPVLILFALLAGQHVAGIVGLIFAVPVLSIVQTLFLFMREKLYGEEPAPGA
jgi:predicted PurR-regulated permease PerM